MCKSNNFSHLLVAAISFWSVSAFSCPVPVYRYGLERWQPDFFQVYFLYDKQIPPEDQKALDALENSPEGKPLSVNLRVFKSDVSDKGKIDTEAKLILETFKPDKFPYAVVDFPSSARIKAPLWKGRLTPEISRLLVDSPARREVARRILSGECAVWIFVESGNKDKDGPISEKLSAELKIAETDLNARNRSEGANEPPPGFAENVMNLPVKTSILRVGRNDPSEKMFMEMLSVIAPEKMDNKNLPAAIPVFARGRMLDVFTGKDIGKENVDSVMNFLVGKCSCEVKAMNPGNDLLMAVDWGGMIYGNLVIDEVLPPLKGIGELADNPAEKTVIKPKVKKTPVIREESRSNIPSLITMLVASVISALILSFLFTKLMNKK